MMDSPGEDGATISDECLVRRILAGNTELYGIIVQRYNRRLYRVTWAILQGEDVEDVIQETYLQAYMHLAQFAGKSLFSTWLTRIAVQEAWTRAGERGRRRSINSVAATFERHLRVPHTAEHELLAKETNTLLEQAICALPDTLRFVFVMRSLENMTSEETSKCLGISKAAVKVRLLRARRMLRRLLYERANAASSDAFRFLGAQCDQITGKVLSRIAHE